MHCPVRPAAGVAWSRVATVESAPAAPPVEGVEVREAAGGVTQERAGGTYVIDIIRSGWNTAGTRYYPAEVLERDLPRVYGRGTHMHIDHPGQAEQTDRPERSLSTLAAVFLEDPWPVRADDGTVVMRTTAKVFGPWRELISEVWPHIGVSINGRGQGHHGEREGRHGLIVEQLTHGQSVDFVTRPGAGGRVVGLLESAREVAALLREAGSLGAHLESRIHLAVTQLADDLYADGLVTRDERITLSAALGDALAAYVARVERDAPQIYMRDRWADPASGEPTETREDTAEETRHALAAAARAAYGREAWVRDWDPERGLVWVDAPAPDDPGGPAGTWQQSYQRDERGRVELLGARVRVQPRTVYTPITSETAAAADDREDTMRTEDQATREADALAVVTRERDEALAALARYEAASAAQPIIDELLAESDLPPAAQARVRAEYRAGTLPLTEARRLDEAALRQRVQASISAESAYVAQIAEQAGAGRVTGLGGEGLLGPSGAPMSTAESASALAAIYERRGMSPEAARAAAAGRR